MLNPRNAIVMMFDTLSAKYIGCYGNDWIKTPNIDRLAKEGALFENWYTEGLPTIPCRRAMLTGRFTLPVSGWVPLSMEDTTIADLCWGRSIDTALIFDCPMYRLPKFGGLIKSGSCTGIMGMSISLTTKCFSSSTLKSILMTKPSANTLPLPARGRLMP